MKKLIISIITVGMLWGCGASKNSANKGAVEPSSPVNTEVEAEKSVEVEDEIIGQPVYHASETILTDLIHTKLEVSFNWGESQLNGKATLTLSPKFYSTDSLILDAQAMEILSVKLNGKSLNYKYEDAQSLRIKLDREYTRKEEYKVEITYIAKPEEKEIGGSSAISSNKGLYFINPKGENKNQMPQIWTQGETEANSVWFPTFDRPNFKTTQEMFITVDDKYKTLSNGRLVSSKKNKDGTRTDYWKQDLPHAPYLFMMTIGEFSVIEDSYTKKDGTVIPVHYYVEPEWAEYAQAIFGETPAMIKFFSELLGVEYPWDKYHQVVVREYVSGAMENTSASLYGDFVYRNSRELIDADANSIMAHELFHHWFGNLVTLESWANLPLNESFANYSQYLWDEHHSGRDEADYNAETEKNGYYQTAASQGHHNMIWYDYDEHEDMFDAHAYNKGGRILHMLRYHLGDEAFFEGLKLYLNDNAYKTAEIAHLRLAFEEVSGEDLNWFFNQWFLASHHPELKITQTVEENQVIVRIEQKQDLEKAPLYILPMKIGVYSSDTGIVNDMELSNYKVSYDVVVDKNINEFVFPINGKLNNIVVDEDRMTLGTFSHDKPREWYVHQYYNAPRYLDRKEAITYGSRLRTDEGRKMIVDALNDEFWHIRQLALEKLDRLGQDRKDEIFGYLKNLAENDKSSKVRSAAISALGNQFLKGNYAQTVKDVFSKAIQHDRSYLVVSRALESLSKGNEKDIQHVLELAKDLEAEQSSSLKTQIIDLYKNHGDISNMDFMSETLLNGDITGYSIFGALLSYNAFYKEQKIEDQEKYFYVFKELSTTGGAFTQAILPMLIMDLMQDFGEKAETLSEAVDSFEAAGNVVEKTKAEEELMKRKELLKKLEELIKL